MTRTLLVVHPGAIGDVFLARPAMRRLRAAYPAHAMGLLARHDVGLVLQVCQEADRLFPLESDALAGLLVGHEAVAPALRQWLRDCDLALCWMDDPGGLHATLEASGVAHAVIQPPSKAFSRTHQSDRFLQTLEGLGWTTGIDRRLEVPDAIKEEGRAGLLTSGITNEKIVVIHPGSGSPHKCVASDVLANVVHALHARGMPVVVILGPADEDRGQELIEQCTIRPVVVQGLDLLSVAGMLANVALYIGHDSGLTHLAAALAVPTLALFGPTDASRWTPLGPRVVLLSGMPCRCEGWETVKRCTEKPCLNIAPERILVACKSLLAAEPLDASSDRSALPYLVLPQQLC